MKAVVVGAGITGCISAIKLCKMGYQVSVYDAGDIIGGVLNDLCFGEEYYFNGCQYLHVKAPWLAELYDIIGSELVEFDSSYGSYTSIIGESIVSNNFAAPVFKYSLKNEEKNYTEAYSFKQRLLNYPDSIANGLINWSARYAGDTNVIHQDCALGVQLSRIYLDYDDKHLLNLKHTLPYVDQIYGVPKLVLNPNLKPARVALPKYGFGRLFDLLKTYMQELGINFYLQSPVVPKFDTDKQCELLCRKENISGDMIVWAANPVPLIHASGFGKLDNPACKMLLLACDVEGGCVEQIAHYIQVYSNKSDITRIYFYQHSNKYKATIECFDSKSTKTDDVVASANQILRESGFDINLQSVGALKQKRYIFYTLKDMERFESFEKFSQSSNVIGGGWEYYARDTKIDVIFDRIDKKLAL